MLWVQASVSSGYRVHRASVHCLVLGPAPVHVDVRAAGRTETGGVFSVCLVQGEYCSSFGQERCVGRGHFSVVAWVPFFPDEKQKQCLDVFLPF